MTWQPIETAPKDGTPIMVTGGNIDSAGSNSVPLIVEWNGNWWGAIHYCYIQPIAENPIYWMPLPNSPTEENKE